MSGIAYYRSSSVDQSVEAQRVALGGGFDREFMDEAVSGAVLAADRPGFAELLAYVRDGDLVCVYAVDRLGRDALDVQATVRKLLRKNVGVEVRGLGLIGPGAGELVLAVLAQVADMERQRIAERCASGRAAARASLDATGRTHRGKASLGRPKACSADEVVAWRKANAASATATARHFNISAPTVKRYCAAAK